MNAAWVSYAMGAAYAFVSLMWIREGDPLLAVIWTLVSLLAFRGGVVTTHRTRWFVENHRKNEAWFKQMAEEKVDPDSAWFQEEYLKRLNAVLNYPGPMGQLLDLTKWTYAQFNPEE